MKIKMPNWLFKRKLSKLGLDMSDKKEAEIAETLNEKGLGGNHFIKCMETAIATKNLQKVCELLSGRKKAGRYLQKKPLVIQCHSCQENFAIKKGVDFAGETINLESLENIVKHLINCDGVICDCGKKVLYFEKCKNCGLEWDKRSVDLMRRNPKMRTKKEKEQIVKYQVNILNKNSEDKK